MRNGLRNLFLAGSLAAFTLALSASSASAGILVKSAPDCSPKPASQAFARWGDTAQYNLAPGGSFEAGTASWSLSGRASMVSGNEPWKVAGAGHSRSLKLPPGASATSPRSASGSSTPPSGSSRRTTAPCSPR